MINVELQNLVTRLDPELKQALEGAAGECVSRGHFAIEPEHWFVQLLKLSSAWRVSLEKAKIVRGL
ncbi:hypothetical protein [Shewanella psychropiezotolerans]|uniref:hypothetical protein n=1 Tax=Shewanella psychropiezotolerans TaxID=2593655 RepID=UPI001E5C0A67|nr:hypothetical protein [Shewanella psychropiezotolerans]